LVVDSVEVNAGKVVNGALPKARQRVGEKLLPELFRISANH
jgi:hypothetical protein